MSKVILITGGSRGIGAAVSLRAARAGFNVAVNFRKDKDAANYLLKKLTSLGCKVRAFQADVRYEEEIIKMFKDVKNEMGSLSALVNSAGVGGKHMLVNDFDKKNLELLMQVNVIGTMLCCREATRIMSTNLGGKGGAIVNISSMAATIGGRPGNSAYAASKAAIDSFSVGFAKEVGTQ